MRQIVRNNLCPVFFFNRLNTTFSLTYTNSLFLSVSLQTFFFLYFFVFHLVFSPAFPQNPITRFFAWLMLFLHSFLWEAVYSCFWLLLLVGQIVRYNPLCALKWLRVPANARNQIIITITGNEQEFGISQHFGFFSFPPFVPSDSKVLTASYWSLSK